MAEVFVVYRISPEDVDVDLEKIAEEIKKLIEKKERIRFQEYKIEPLAFGIKILKIAVYMPDEGGIVDELAEEIKKIEGVSDVEMESAKYVG